MNKNKKIQLSLISLLLIMTVSLLSSFTSYSTNNLSQLSTQWVTLKKNLDTSVMGADDSIQNRATLMHNKLLPNAWYGYNGYFINNMVSPKSISFELDFKKDLSDLHVIFDYNQSGFKAIRLSSKNEKRNSLIQAQLDGKYNYIKTLNLPKFSRNNQFTITFKDQFLDISWRNKNKLNNREIKIPFKLTQGLVGFIGSNEANITVDNYKVITSNNETIFENFSNSNFIGSVLFSTFVILIFLSPFFLISFFTEQKYNYYLIILLLFNFIIGTLYFVDYKIWSKNFFVQYQLFSTKSRAELQIEKVRQSFFNLSSHFNKQQKKTKSNLISPLLKTLKTNQKNCQVNKMTRYQPNTKNRYHETHTIFCEKLKRKKTLNIGFIGTSQTYGSGAANIQNAWVSLFTSHIFKQNSCNILTTNISISGSNPADLYNDYITKWKSLTFDYVFINLVNNDKFKTLTENLPKIIQETVARGATPILILEATEGADRNKEKLQYVKKVAEENKIKTIDLNNHFNSPEVVNSGLLWLDYIHFSQYGHKVAADFLFDNSKIFLNEKCINK